ncbi:MAG: glycosyltransferase N-terminal domain-containing protein [Ferruginibacter sp.]
MGIFFYNIFLILYTAGIRIASLFNRKARAWVKGRKNLFTELRQWREHIGPSAKTVWMHCASLGEFEQGRPVLEQIKARYPSYKILLTFFSPGGYEIRKDYPGADGIFYLPADGKKNAALFTAIVKPHLVLWVKYEYWYHYLTALRDKKIPVVLVSAVFREGQPFFNRYGGIWKEMLGCFTRIFVQDEHSVNLLGSVGMAAQAVPAGDTRFDRVIAIAENRSPLPVHLADFGRGNKLIVAGSTWEEDEELLVHYVKIHPTVKFIIAPHEIDNKRLHEAKKLFGNALFYSEYVADNGAPQVLIIDNIGMLSRLYELADITYVGGGFTNSGIHNILEAAVYGKPVIFGPVYEKFHEATELSEIGGAFPVNNALELEALLNRLFSDKAAAEKASALSRNYVYEKRGATEKILGYLQEKRLLTN